MGYRSITDLNEIKELLRGKSPVAFDFETSATDEWRNDSRAALDAHKSVIAGVSFSFTEGDAFYVPLTHRCGRNAEKQDELWAFLKDEIFESDKVIKIAHNLAFESMFLYAKGITVQMPCYDTIAAAQLTLKSQFEFRNLHDSGLKLLSTTLFGADMPSFEMVTAGRFFDEMNPQDKETIRYACADSDYTLRLYYKFNAWFDKYMPNHCKIVELLESPTAVYVGLMKYNGVPMNRAAMEKARVKADEEIKKLAGKIAELIGDVEIGSNCSTTAFKNYLYKTQNLPVLKQTDKYLPSVDDEAMIRLKEYCTANKPELAPLFDLVLEYRKWQKLNSTYFDGYLSCVNDATGCIHPDLMPLATETGRFACRKPNMQNCYDEDTEILTKRGFVQFRDLNDEDMVAEWDNGEIYFVKPKCIVHNPYNGDMVRIKNQHIDLLITPKHRCLLQNRKNNQYYVVPADEYSADAKQLQAGQFTFGSKDLSADFITLLAATQADGSYHGNQIEFRFEKARKLRRLMNAIMALGIPYHDSVNARGLVCVILEPSEMTELIRQLLGIEKTWGAWLLEYDRKTVKRILAELPEWDGCFTRGSMYSSSVKKNAEWMQILYVLTGIRCHMRTYHNGNPNSKENYQLDISDRDYSLTSNVERSIETYDGIVHCVTVDSGFIVVRRNGQVCISGNSPQPGQDPVGVRNFITAPEGWSLIEADYSQAEIRLCAYIANDKVLLDAYRNGIDVHAITTSAVFNISLDEASDHSNPQYKHRRTVAKATMFGIMYGIGGAGLSKNLYTNAGVVLSKEECDEYIRGILGKYTDMAAWQISQKKQAKDAMYVETAMGRRRYLPGIRSRENRDRSSAERMAINTPVQGLGADCLKHSMMLLIKALKGRTDIKPILTVHDSLVFLVKDESVKKASELIKRCMETPPPLPNFMPLVAEVSAGKKYGELE